MFKRNRIGKKSLFKKFVWWIAYFSGGSIFAEAANSILNEGLVSSMLGTNAVSKNGSKMGGSSDAGTGTRSSFDNTKFTEKFAEHKYDRTLAKIYLSLCGISLLFFLMYLLYGIALFGALSVTILAFLVGYAYASIRYFSKDYELIQVNGIDVIVPGELFRFSITGGRANDPFIDYENKMRSCLLQSHGMPEKMDDSTTHFECVSFDDDKIVFRFYFSNVFGAYEFLKQNADRFASEFGDLDGAELKKVRDGVFEIVIDQMKTDFNSKANVRWDDEKE